MNQALDGASQESGYVLLKIRTDFDLSLQPCCLSFVQFFLCNQIFLEIILAKVETEVCILLEIDRTFGAFALLVF